jgi:hypothetical protein
MICFTNDDRIDGAGAEEKLKKLTDMTRRLFLVVYKERGYQTPFIELELEFMNITGEDVDGI